MNLLQNFIHRVLNRGVLKAFHFNLWLSVGKKDIQDSDLWNLVTTDSKTKSLRLYSLTLRDPGYTGFALAIIL